MPLSSMTGFGQAEVSTPSGNYRIEIRSVNGRFLEIQTRIPKSFVTLEAKIKTLISSCVSRGSVSIFIGWEHEQSDGRLVYDKKAVDDYVAIFREIQKKYSLKDDVSLSNLLIFSDFITKQTIEYPDATIWTHLKPALEKALVDFNLSRQREAAFIVKDLKKMVKSMNKTIAAIEQWAPQRLKVYTIELKRRIEQLIEKGFDQSRFAMEIALLADRLDISEECTRLRAHIDKLNSAFDSEEPVGKRIGFIQQEMNREANTIASKANDTKISHWSVELKENIEKIREQSLNFE